VIPPVPMNLALALLLVLAACRQPDPTWLVVDRDADPMALGGHPGALFTVDPDSGKVAVFCASDKWKNPVDVLQDRDGLLVLDYGDTSAGGIFRVSGNGKEVSALQIPKGLVDPTQFLMTSDGAIWIVDKNADPLGLGKKANCPTGTLWRLSPDRTQLEIIATGPPLRAPACVQFVDGIPYLLDADSFRTEPISEEGAIFRIWRHPRPVETFLRLQGLLSPISMQPFRNGTFLVVDVNADPDPGQRSRYRGAVYLVDPGAGSTTLFCNHAEFRDPASCLVLDDAHMLLVDASADPNHYGRDGLGEGYGGFGRGALFRIDLAQRRASVVCASKQFVNPVRVKLLRR
jgi:hypothetical protein